jgi:hypothetical protein
VQRVGEARDREDAVARDDLAPDVRCEEGRGRAVATRPTPTVAAESVTFVFGVMPTSSCASTTNGKLPCFHAACPERVSFTVGFDG